MGGADSGRHGYRGAKDTTEDYRSIDVRRWKRDGLLTPYRSFGWQWLRSGKVVASIQVHTETNRVILNYRHQSKGEDWKDESYPVNLVWTTCHLGGKRPWFLCPAQGCGRRVAILYCGGIFACRQCYRLTYPSQRETRYYRAMHRADKIRDRLGWKPGILNDHGPKPRGMHWRTFERLKKEHDAFVQTSLDGMTGS